jgi:N-methylhydantoinase A
MHSIGVDVGGTFTDLVLIDDAAEGIRVAKTLSTPGDPSIGVRNALHGLQADLRMADKFVHATTVATNALIQRTGAKVGMITTQGFRDTLELMREDRQEVYSYQWDRPRPLVPRHLRVEVRERLNANGEVLVPLDEQSVIEVVKYLRARQVDAIAVCLLFLFLNCAHEARVRDIVTRIFPESYVSLSSEILPEIREYERSSTVAIDAYLKPIMDRYLAQLEKGVRAMGYRHDVSLFKSNGGVTSLQEARKSPVHLMASGPAGGVIAAKTVADIIGKGDVIAVDMGGTSFDASLIHRGKIPYTRATELEWGIPVRIPFVDVHSIAAGGGTIASYDQAGVLKVGPASAGASPGPACYGRGGRQPTVTDANLVLGRLDPAFFLGGAMPLFPEAAQKAIDTYILPHLGRGLADCAQGVLDVVNANMAQAVRVIRVEKGYDPREFALFAYGGAGP